MKIAVTGHRPDKLNNDYAGTSILSESIYDELAAVVNRNTDVTIITGMALGVDTLFAWVGIDMKRPIIAAIPFIGQEKQWPDASQKVYRDILNNSLVTQKVISEPGYAAYKMQKRNEWMVDNCDGLIAVWNGTPGGTANCVRYAQSKGTKIVFIDPTKLRQK